MPRTLLFLVFPDFQILDATGPMAAFEVATRLHGAAYRLRVASMAGGLVSSSSGMAVASQRIGSLRRVDTLVVAGGLGTREARRDAALMRLLRRAATHVPRVASVCSGALLLAHAGVLDDRSATTHWSRVRDMQQHYPRVRIEADRIFVRDGKFWTSAGISAGIDLALAMIADDHGPDLARDVARYLVVYAKRPGGQTQHSRLLELGTEDERFTALHVWMRERLREDLRVEALAAHMKMSTRTFARAYLAVTSVTPAKAVERLRVEAARALIESGSSSMFDVATQTGFGDIERMRRAFVRLFGFPPSSLRRSARVPSVSKFRDRRPASERDSRARG
jgi:transcriptional regulator GlxA family with amidase domain